MACSAPCIATSSRAASKKKVISRRTRRKRKKNNQPMNMPDFGPLEERLGHAFRDRSLLLQALTHRSYLNENTSYEYPHNERLEFLGDAVLELVVTEYLYKNYANDEGELTNWRAALVSAKPLAVISPDLK